MAAGSSTAERRQNDLSSLKALADASGGNLFVEGASGNPISEIIVVARFKTSRSARYPDDVQDTVRLIINLGANYPFQQPRLTTTSEVFHPHVGGGGWICIGNEWLPSEKLENLVKRVIRTLAYESHLINTGDPANGEAKNWYVQALRKHPNAFPSDNVVFRTAAPSSKRPRVWGNAGGSRTTTTTTADPPPTSSRRQRRWSS